MQLEDYLQTLALIKKLHAMEHDEIVKIEAWIIGDILKPKKMLPTITR